MNTKQLLETLSEEINNTAEAIKDMRMGGFLGDSPSTVFSAVGAKLEDLAEKVSKASYDIDFDVPTETAVRLTELAQALYLTGIKNRAQTGYVWKKENLSELAESCLMAAAVFGKALKEHGK